MSRKYTRCGIYAITAPDGSQYIGGSTKIERRWSEHKSTLRYGKHSTPKLQGAWDKYGKLELQVLQECDQDSLKKLEQEWIDRLKPTLNTTAVVDNVWMSKETREKLKATYSTQEFKDKRSKISAAISTRWVAVDCSDGRSFKNMADAARAFGVRVSGIACLVKSQRIGRLGVKFKLASDEWVGVLTSRQQRLATMKERGTNIMTAETRAKMSASAKARIARESRPRGPTGVFL